MKKKLESMRGDKQLEGMVRDRDDPAASSRAITLDDLMIKVCIAEVT